MRGAEVTMKSRVLLGIGFGMVAVSAVLAQGQAPPNPAVNLQATNDPRYGEVIAKCKTPPPGRGGGGGGGGAARPGGAPGGGAAPGAAAGQGRGAAAPGGAAGAGRGPAAAAGPAEYTVTAI